MSGAEAGVKTAAAAPRPSLAARGGLFVMRALRYLYGVFYFLAGVNKLVQGWLWSDRLRVVFEERLAQLEPGSFGAVYLAKFGIPFYPLVAWSVTVLELVIGLGFLLGLAMRVNIWLALFLTVNIGIGGYYDASLIPFLVIPALLLFVPAAWRPGLDARLRARYPGSFWFRA